MVVRQERLPILDSKYCFPVVVGDILSTHVTDTLFPSSSHPPLHMPFLLMADDLHLDDKGDFFFAELYSSLPLLRM